MSYDLLRKVLDEFHEPVEEVTVKASLRSQYGIKGRDGGLDRKVSRGDFPKSIGLYAELKLNQKEIDSDGDRGVWARLFSL